MVMKADRMKYPRVLSEKEVAQLFRKAEIRGNLRDEMLLKCIYYLGLKSNEVQNIKVEDIDVKLNTIKIKGTSGKKERQLLIPGKFPFELLKFTKGKRPDELVFSGRGQEGGMSDRHIRRMVKDYAKMADLQKYEEIKPHTLRISYAAHLRKEGISVKNIQKILGHTRRETTYIYTHGLKKIESKGKKPKQNQDEADK
jgi:site-specific recombinase XerD